MDAEAAAQFWLGGLLLLLSFSCNISRDAALSRCIERSLIEILSLRFWWWWLLLLLLGDSSRLLLESAARSSKEQEPETETESSLEEVASCVINREEDEAPLTIEAAKSGILVGYCEQDDIEEDKVMSISLWEAEEVVKGDRQQDGGVLLPPVGDTKATVASGGVFVFLRSSSFSSCCCPVRTTEVVDIAKGNMSSSAGSSDCGCSVEPAVRW